jgi:hypothetical protein
MADRIRKINKSTNTTNVVILSGLPANARIQAMEVGNDGLIYCADFDQDVLYKIYESGRIMGVLDGALNTPGVVHATGVGAGGTGLTARLTAPTGLTVDSSGNIYIGCATANLIRRASPSGRIVPFVGHATLSGDVVSDDGAAVRFNSLSTGMGLCVDKAGVVYIADSGNHKIKKMWPSGKTTTLAGGPAGAGASGFVNATGNTARFNNPLDVAVDNQGNVYVADSTNHRIRKITESGVVTTLAGDGTIGSTDGNGTVARFRFPQRIAIDPSNQFLYVMENATAASIRKVDMHGNTTTFMHYNPPGSGNGDISVDKSGFLYILENDV